MEDMIYIIELTTKDGTVFAIEIVRAISLREAKAYLIERYGEDIMFGTSKVVY